MVHAVAVYRKPGACQLQTLCSDTQGQTVCISAEMKTLAEALTRALVTTVRVLLPMELNTGNTRHRAKELAPSQSPGPWPMVAFSGSAGQAAGGKLGTCPSPAAGFIGGLDIPPPRPLPFRLKKQIYSNCQGRPGQASVWAAPAELLSLQKCVLWRRFKLLAG